MKTPVKIGIVVVLLLLIAGSGTWFWSLGALASEAVPAMRIEVTQGSVQLKRASQSDWQTITNTTDVQAGDDIRTGADGLATIRWGDHGESRIDGSSEVTVQAMPADASAATDSVIKLQLSGGRVWTRLLKLLDVQSAAQVTTGNVVATVRGTAFGVAANDGADLAVTESVVSIGAVDSNAQTLVREGRWGHFSASGTPVIVRELTDQDTWAVNNRKADGAFDDALRNEMEQRFAARHVSAPSWLVALSENVHVALAGNSDDAARLKDGYARRHLADAVTSPDQADKLISELQDFNGKPDDLLLDIRLGLLLNQAHPDRRLSDALQNLRLRLLSKTDVGARYALALTIDDNIDGVVFPVAPLSPTDRTNLIIRLDKDIDDWQQGNGAITGTDRALLDQKADAMRERLAGLDQPLTPPAEATSTPAVAPTSTPDVVPTPPPTTVTTKPPVVGPTTPPSPSVTPPPSTCTSERLTMFAKPSGAYVGDSVTLSLLASCSDGTTKDVTSLSAFNLASQADGQLRGNIFIPARTGTITLTGTFQENGKTYDAKTSITASASAKRLTGVSASAIGTTDLTTGQSAPVTAKATYSDGSTQDVTYTCVWSTSDPRLGIVSNQRFQSLTGTGTDTAICSYTDNGVTLSGGVTFTITLDPALTPSGGCVPNYQIGKYCP